MRKSTLTTTALVSIFSLGLAGSALAQDTSMSTTERVVFKLEINQPSLFNPKMNDTFVGSVDDRSGTTTFKVECSAGSSAFMGLVRSDEKCSVTGSGTIKNLNNPAQMLPRVNYAGGFTILGKEDGYTDMRTIGVNYVAVGTAPAIAGTFGGHLIMMPENPSAGALALGAKLVEDLKAKAAGTGETVEYDTAIDSMQFLGLTIPAVGQTTGTVGVEPCSWTTNDWIYSYAADAWGGSFDLTCGSEKIRLEGSMPLSPEGDAYTVNLIVPSANGGAGDPFAAPDPFATVNGITGTLKFENSGRMTEDEVYEHVVVTGELVGNGVPLEAVRGWGEIMLVFARTFYGA